MVHQPALVDALLAAVLTALAVDTALRTSTSDWLAYLLAVLAVAPVALRQRVPVLATWIMAGAMAAYGMLGYGDGELPGSGIGMIIGMFTVATLRPRRVAVLAFVPATATTAAFLVGVGLPIWSSLAMPTLLLLGAWGLGDATRRWARRTEQIAARAARAVADERVRIARELHDIVTHHMAVVSLQTGLAHYVLDTDPPTAKAAISAAGDAGRQALAEMRRLLDVLRVDPDADADPDADYRPRPGLSDLDLLVDRTRKAGLPVDVVVTGRPRELSPGPDLCAYRVAQESLTNILKHAGPAAARIELDYGEQTFSLTVSDDGNPSAAAPPAPDSHGIRGMRERAGLYGGVLTAGPREQRGFAVTLRLPITEDGS
ncbi:sensor histidine kinase [Pseudonocardia eucalypti]|uniref:histidine kinase n=1 Tax=Pseudonocardia eucalypti TaxID=648755 RepID=A0ABP9PMZ9_9PSEU